MGFFQPSTAVGQALNLEDYGGCQDRHQKHDYAANAQAKYKFHAFKNHFLAPNSNCCDLPHAMLSEVFLAIAPKRVTKGAVGNLIHSRL